MTIRKFRREKYTIADLVKNGTMTKELAEFLRACVQQRLNILISGGTGTGKTTLLNALSAFIPDTRAHHHDRGPDRDEAAADARDLDGGAAAEHRRARTK